jgi:group I intron endonuclease
MEKKQMSYQNGKIYCIRNYINDEVYVGSTTDLLSKRFSTHKRKRNSVKSEKIPLYMLMRDIGKDNFYIELMEEYPCNNLEQLRKREGEMMRLYGTLNKRIAGRDSRTYNEENREHKADINKRVLLK